jgi:signal transduction histidine kinase
MTPRLLFVGCLLLLVCSAMGQNAKIEALKNELEKARDDDQRVELLNQLVAQTWDYSFEEGLSLAEEAYEIAQRKRNARGMALSGTSIGMYHYFKGDYSKALQFYWRALQTAGGKVYGDIPAYTLVRIANLYRVQGSLDSSAWYYRQAFLSMDTTAVNSTLSSAYYNLGLLQTTTADFDNARLSISKALAMRTQLGDSLLMAECWRALGNVFKNVGQVKEARKYYELANQVAERTNNPELVMFSHVNLGELDFLEGKNVKAMTQFSKALEILRTHDFKRYHAIVLQLMGRVFDAEGAYDRSLESFLKSLQIDEEIGSVQTAARTRGMLAWVHIRQRQDSLAFHFANLSLSQCESLRDKEGIAFANNVLGYIHFVRKEYASSIAYYERALAQRDALKLVALASNTRYNLSRVYEEQGNAAKAIELLNEVVGISRTQNSRLGLISALNSLASISIRMKDFSKASYFLTEAQELAIQSGARLELRDNYKIQAELAKALNQPTKANLYYEKYIQLNDSLFNNQSTEKIAELNALYQLDKTQNEIQMLSAQNELNQKRLEVQRGQLRWQKAILVAAVIGSVLLAIIAFVLNRYYKDTSKAANDLRLVNKDLQERKEEIETQAEEIQEAHDRLLELNREMKEQQEEIQAQSEELIEANHTIQSVNRNLEEAVEERTAKLKEAYRELDTFFYRASHDFRRPLTTFMGLAEVATITVRDSNALELFEKVRETARNLDKMLNKLQSVSAVAGSDSVYREVFFQQEADRIYDSFKEEFIKQQIDFVTRINPGKSYWSYPAIVRIILTNLVENAIHFATPDRPKITLVVEDEPGHLIIRVEDNGEGIRPEYQDKVFDMYFRASDKSKGNGLGLYIVRKAVEKLRGTIQLESVPGQGTIITVRLPANEHFDQQRQYV